MSDSAQPADPPDAKAAAVTDLIVGTWALTTFAGLIHLLELIVRSARGEQEVRMSRTGTFALSFGLAGLVIRLSSRMQREHRLGETVTRLGVTVHELEQVMKAGANEAARRDERAATREERMEAIARSTLWVAAISLAVAVLGFALTVILTA
jgi:hypothetical protein